MTADADPPFDVGLQTERTLLAWRRTCLALSVGNAVAIRYLAVTWGLWATVLGVVGLALAALAWLLATLRYRRAHGALVAGRAHPSDGRLPLVLAGSVLAAAVAAAVIVVALGHPF